MPPYPLSLPLQVVLMCMRTIQKLLLIPVFCTSRDEQGLGRGLHKAVCPTLRGNCQEPSRPRHCPLLSGRLRVDRALRELRWARGGGRTCGRLCWDHACILLRRWSLTMGCSDVRNLHFFPMRMFALCLFPPYVCVYFLSISPSLHLHPFIHSSIHLRTPHLSHHDFLPSSLFLLVVISDAYHISSLTFKRPKLLPRRLDTLTRNSQRHNARPLHNRIKRRCPCARCTASDTTRNNVYPPPCVQRGWRKHVSMDQGKT